MIELNTNLHNDLNAKYTIDDLVNDIYRVKTTDVTKYFTINELVKTLSEKTEFK